MNDITVFGNNEMTMSSREIAELTGKQHKDVLYDIRNMLEKLEIESAQFSADYKDAKGRTYQEFRLDRELTLTLVSGYDIPLRHRVVTRLAELENAPKALNPASLSRLQLIELAMQAEQERLVLEHKVEALAPKVEALDRIATADGSMPVSTAAKLLQIRPTDAFAWLSGHKWIFKRHGGSPWLGYQDKIQQGLLEMKVVTVERSDGSSKAIESVLVTAKGLGKLAGLMGREAA